MAISMLSTLLHSLIKVRSNYENDLQGQAIRVMVSRYVILSFNYRIADLCSWHRSSLSRTQYSLESISPAVLFRKSHNKYICYIVLYCVLYHISYIILSVSHSIYILYTLYIVTRIILYSACFRSSLTIRSPAST